MTYQEIRNNEEVCALLDKGNQNLGVLGFTDHSEAHCLLVAERAAYILRKLGYSDRDEELARIAGFMHDIGNAINRTHHAELGALLANDILKQTDMPMADRIAVIAAIGQHDESTHQAEDSDVFQLHHVELSFTILEVFQEYALEGGVLLLVFL